MDLDTVMGLSLDEYIHLKRIEHPERAQKAKMSLSKFDRYRDAEEEESEEDEDEGLVCAAANIKLENEESLMVDDMEQMPPLVRINKPNTIWDNVARDEPDNRVSVHKRIGNASWKGSQSSSLNLNRQNNSSGVVRKHYNNNNGYHNNGNNNYRYRNNNRNPYKVTIQDRLQKDYQNANDMISKKIQEVCNVIQFNGRGVVDSFASKLVEKVENIQNGRDRDLEKYNMTIQKEISNIQNKPMFFKCPGGAVVSQDGPGIDAKINWQNSTGISLNQRFA